MSRPDNAVLIGEDKVASWQYKLSAQQIRNILNTVEDFMLGNLYGDSVIPLEGSLVDQNFI